MDQHKNKVLTPLNCGGSLKVLRSEDLFGEGKTVYIRHGGSLYRLMKTRSGKLILNK